MTAPGRWQREYDQNWRNYAKQEITKHLGTYALEYSPIVTQADERQLRDVLAAAGIKHAPLNHSRWHAPTPASQTTFGTLASHDSIAIDESYVYNTPPACDSQSLFPAFNSQDFVSQSPSRRVSPSQRLQMRMANTSPIAATKSISIDCAGTISPPSGAAKSPWTPGQWSPKPVGNTRRTPRRSLEANLKDDVNLSMRSFQLSDDVSEAVPVKEDNTGVREDAQMVNVSKANKKEGDAASAIIAIQKEEKTHTQNVQCVQSDVNELDLMTNDADETNVSKQLDFSSDSDQDDGEKTNNSVAHTHIEDDKVYADVPDDTDHGMQQVQGTTKNALWPSGAGFEFGNGNEYDTEDRQQKDEQQDFEMREPEQLIVDSTNNTPIANQAVGESTQEEGKSVKTSGHASTSSMNVAKQNGFPAADRPAPPSPNVSPLTSCLSLTDSSARKRAYASITDSPARRPTFVSSTTSSTKRTSIASPERLSIQVAQTPPTSPSSLKPGLSRKRTNRRVLLHTKLPLEMEYRFERDRRRRHRRRKSFVAKPGVFPYVVPDLLVELQPYQAEALQWMLQRERKDGDPVLIEQQRSGNATNVTSLVAKVCGGVLADEMGLGKTICCLALICESLRQARAADALSRSKTGSTIPHLTPPTLIVTPLSILSQWEVEIRAKTNLSVVTYHGASRKSFRAATQFMGTDIVLSTYDTLRLLECKVQVKGSNDDGELADNHRLGTGDGWHKAPRLTPLSKKSVVTSKLHQLQWFRIILDESHLIANAGCARARAAFKLRSQRRWCVTGTPIQNRTADLAALLHFVGLGSRAHALSEGELGALVPQLVMRRLKSTLVAHSRVPILKLPKKTEETIKLDFSSDIERALYMLLHRSTKRQVFQYLQSKEAKQHRRVSLATPTKDSEKQQPSFMHVFELILRLRQVCNACALVTTDPLAEVKARAAAAEALVGKERDGISPFSSGEAELLRRVQQHMKSKKVTGCRPLESTKLIALMKELKKVRARRERALVISQWTSFLDLIAECLEIHNSQCETRVSVEAGNEAISFAKLDGRLSGKDREQVVRKFQQHEDHIEMGPLVGPPLDVLLLSLRTGGLGLNLTAAAHVFIMEPSWNPSLERQAIDRAHRFGQTKAVRVVRFFIRGTIEERVVALQNKKRQLTAAFLDDGDILSSAIKNRLRDTHLSTGDLKRLFFKQSEDEERQRLQKIDPCPFEDLEGSDASVTCIEISD